MSSTTIAPTGPRFADGAGLIALVASAHLLVDGSVGFLSVLLPSFQARFELTPFEASVLVAVLAATTSLTQPLFGLVADRIGYRVFVVAGVFMSTSLLAAASWAPNVGVLALLLAIGGLGSGAFHPAATTAVHLTPVWPETAVGLLTAGGMVGMTLGPVAAVTLFATISGPWTVATLAITAAVAAWLLWWRLPSDARLAGRSRTFDRRLMAGAPGRLALAASLASLAAITFLNATPLALVVDGRAPTDPVIGLVLGTFTGAAAVGTVASSTLVRRLGRAPVVVGSMLAAPLPLALTLAVTPHQASYWVAVAAAGVLVHGALPTMVVAAQDAVPGSETAAAGLVVGGAMGAAGLAYPLVGHLQSVVGIRPASGMAFAALIPAAWVAARTLHHPHRASRSGTAMPCRCPAPA